jgi:rhamnosyltransferase
MLVIDSSSLDGTDTLARNSGFRVIVIEQQYFNHGGTRQKAAACIPKADILIYLTQDAIPADPDSFKKILDVFNDPQIGAAYGRQLPRREAGPLEAHARYFNYPPDSEIRTFESRASLGIKAIFSSNSFAAYRRSALEQVGGFSGNAIVSEETIVFARLQMAGWKTAYVADATVIHSHGYTLAEEFSRYFDIGVGHERESWIEKFYPSAYGEGRRFVVSEIKYLFPRYVHLIPLAILHTIAKAAGYKLGRLEAHLPIAVKRLLSAQKHFWNSTDTKKGFLDFDKRLVKK